MDEKVDRLTLWLHLVSKHSGIFNPTLTLEELIEEHAHEHDGPCTIRNHPRESMDFSLPEVAKILTELEEATEMFSEENDG